MPTIFDHVEAGEHSVKDGIIYSVSVDGKNLSTEDLDNRGQNVDLKGVSRIDFILESPKAIIRRAFEDGITLGGEILNGLIGLSDKFRTGETSEALSILPYWTEELRQYLTYISDIKNFFESSGIDGFYSDLAADQVQWVETFGELVEAQENSDWVLVADLFEYEIVEIINKCMKILQESMLLLDK